MQFVAMHFTLWSKIDFYVAIPLRRMYRTIIIFKKSTILIHHCTCFSLIVWWLQDLKILWMATFFAYSYPFFFRFLYFLYRIKTVTFSTLEYIFPAERKWQLYGCDRITLVIVISCQSFQSINAYIFHTLF